MNILIKTTTLLFILFSLSSFNSPNNQELADPPLTMKVDANNIFAGTAIVKVTFDTYDEDAYDLHIGYNDTYFPDPSASYAAGGGHSFSYTFEFDQSDFFVIRQKDGLFVNAVRINCKLTNGLSTGNNKMPILAEDNCIVTIGPI